MDLVRSREEVERARTEVGRRSVLSLEVLRRTAISDVLLLRSTGSFGVSRCIVDCLYGWDSLSACYEWNTKKVSFYAGKKNAHCRIKTTPDVSRPSETRLRILPTSHQYSRVHICQL